MRVGGGTVEMQEHHLVAETPRARVEIPRGAFAVGTEGRFEYRTTSTVVEYRHHRSTPDHRYSPYATLVYRVEGVAAALHLDEYALGRLRSWIRA